MTFIEALQSDRPMKRPGTLTPDRWLRLMVLDGRPLWFVVGPTGSPSPSFVGLTRGDYLAEDWMLAPEIP